MTTKIDSVVQGFYNKIPFPDYDLSKFNSKEDRTLAIYPFAKILDRSKAASSSLPVQLYKQLAGSRALI